MLVATDLIKQYSWPKMILSTYAPILEMKQQNIPLNEVEPVLECGYKLYCSTYSLLLITRIAIHKKITGNALSS